MILRRPRTAAIATLSLAGITASSYFYYRRRREAHQTFELPVRVRDASGKRFMTRQTIPLISPAEVEQQLYRFARSGGALRNGIQWRWDTAQLAANNPVEDAFSNVIVERDPLPPKKGGAESSPKPSEEGDLLFFAVLDGHAGPHTSRLLSETLIPIVALELFSLMYPHVQDRLPTAKKVLSYLPYLGASRNSSAHAAPSEPSYKHPAHVSLAIQTAFTRLDSELVNAPVRLLDSLGAVGSDENSKPSEDAWALASVNPAFSGSCALLALLDTGSRHMYVACTGDSRAIAGYFDEGSGTWTVEVLTEDQTGRNPNELKRIQAEHPPDEMDAVIQRGRILGGLEPSRAFGDARYKLEREVQERIASTLFPGTKLPIRTPPAGLKTPPYVTAQPVITQRPLTFLPPVESNSSGAELRFLILATDGLWDEISSEDACALVAGHLSGLRGSVPKGELEKRLRLSTGTRGVEGKEKERGYRGKGTWSFQDSNLATHLVRNALGKGSERKLRELMSIPTPLARKYRDDITATVVWWEPKKESQVQHTPSKL